MTCVKKNHSGIFDQDCIEFISLLLLILISLHLLLQEEGLPLFKSPFVFGENRTMVSTLVQPFLSFLFLFVHFCQVRGG